MPSTKSLAERMHLRAGERLLLVNAPDGFASVLGAPESVEVSTTPQGTFDVIQVFVTTRADLEAEAPRLKALLNPDGKLWLGITYLSRRSPSGHGLEPSVRPNPVSYRDSSPDRLTAS